MPILATKNAKPAAIEQACEAIGLDPARRHELLFYAPHRFIDYTRIATTFSDIVATTAGELICALVQVKRIDYFDKAKRPTKRFVRDEWRRAFRANVIVAPAHSAPGTRAPEEMEIVFFGNLWPLADVEIGATLLVAGRAEPYWGRPNLVSPQIIPLRLAGTVAPVYPALRGKVSADVMHEAVTAIAAEPAARAQAAELLCDRLELTPAHIKALTGITPLQLIESLHTPRSEKQGLYCLQAARTVTAGMILARARRRPAQSTVSPAAVALSDELIDAVRASVERKYRLTADQARAIDEILADLRAEAPMRRLLSGDVSTGKTLTFMMPAVAVQLAGAQSAILAPNELVVKQIADELRELFPTLPVQSVSSATRTLDPQALWVGTTALLSRIARTGKRIDFLVVDEQHKFSRDQREALVRRDTNLLEATATAIPRTMALVTHAGMRVSQLQARPFERNVTTRLLVGAKSRGTLFALVRDVVRSGGQIAIVYPAVQKSKSSIDVEQAAQLWAKHAPGQVVMLHGRLKSEEKAEAIRAFKAGEKQLLVTSTVIEVGVSLPDLRAIIIVNAERYGVAQLHQLRGRVARLGGRGACALYCPQPVNEDTLERLRLMERLDNGFALAEADLELRGFGDLDVGSSVQAGKSVTVFHNITVAPHHLKALEQRFSNPKPASEKRAAP